MNPIVRFIRQREPNSTTVLLMKPQSTLEGTSHRHAGGWVRADSHTARTGFLLHPLGGAPRGQAHRATGWLAGGRPCSEQGPRWQEGDALPELRGAGQGVLAYLSEPASAFSVASCPGTASRRAHTRTSSSHCAASCRGKERTGCCCSGLDRKEAGPPLPGGFTAILQQVTGKKGREGQGSWK